MAQHTGPFTLRMIYLTLILAEVLFPLMDGRGGADLRFQKTVDVFYSSNEWSLVGRNSRDLNGTESARRRTSQSDEDSIADDLSRDSFKGAIPKSVAWSASGVSADNSSVASYKPTSSIVYDRMGKSWTADDGTSKFRESSAAAGARGISADPPTRAWDADEQWTSLESLRRGSAPMTGAEIAEKRGSEEEEETQEGSTSAEMLENVQLWRHQARKFAERRRESANSFGASYVERSARHRRHAIRRSRFRRQSVNLPGAANKTTSTALPPFTLNLSAANTTTSTLPPFTIPPPVQTTGAQPSPLLHNPSSTAGGITAVSPLAAVKNVSPATNASLTKAPHVIRLNASVGPLPSAVSNVTDNRTKEATTVVGFNVSQEPSDVTGAADNITENVSDHPSTEVEAPADTTVYPPAAPAAQETKAVIQEVRAEIIIKNSTLPKKARKKMAKLQLVIVILMAVLLLVLVSLTACLVVNKERLVTVKKVEAPKVGEKQPLIGSGPTPVAPQNMPSPGPAPASPSPAHPPAVGAVASVTPMMPTPSPGPFAVPSSDQLPTTVPSSASFATGP